MLRNRILYAVSGTLHIFYCSGLGIEYIHFTPKWHQYKLCTSFQLSNFTLTS